MALSGGRSRAYWAAVWFNSAVTSASDAYVQVKIPTLDRYAAQNENSVSVVPPHGDRYSRDRDGCRRSGLRGGPARSAGWRMAGLRRRQLRPEIFAAQSH